MRTADHVPSPESRWRPGALATVSALAAVGVLIAGCGGGSSSPGVAAAHSTTSASGGNGTGTAPSGGGPSTASVQNGLRFSECMRSNGVTNYPDPSSNARPLSTNHIDPNSPTFRRAYTACRKDASSGGVGPPAPTAAQLRAALAFAQCIRTHGIAQFPDPLTTYGPGFTLGTGEYFPNTGTYQVMSSAFTHAAKACGVQLPSGPP